MPGCPPSTVRALVGKRELPVRATDGEIVVTVPVVESPGRDDALTGSGPGPTGERIASPTGGAGLRSSCAAGSSSTTKPAVGRAPLLRAATPHAANVPQC
ncbi:hypothetical protein ACQPZQ_15345 [Pseudonocardia sp. CA-142604]|uniref:hypothetical protein n=1 Tax=Pseudonocardia sp. CA-142604 TaxID=3240024 RepID=UPI003D8B50F5